MPVYPGALRMADHPGTAGVRSTKEHCDAPSHPVPVRPEVSWIPTNVTSACIPNSPHWRWLCRVQSQHGGRARPIWSVNAKLNGKGNRLIYEAIRSVAHRYLDRG